ncbi:dinitrogenase iron-molybdenum cofactor biosynthesis protein [candidate division KSB1 bacterium]|nr:dinitrogenase iron-molybdenum cofactor biosynthesis protein [candidate division KSB1 bacterium]
MRVAITTWQERISPLFDTSQWLQITDVDEDGLKSHLEYMGDQPPLAKVEKLKNLRADILICGAITRPVYMELIRSGMAVHPFICGRVEEVLEVYRRNRKIEGRFAMPGYGRRLRQRNRHQRGGRHSF